MVTEKEVEVGNEGMEEAEAAAAAQKHSPR